MLRILWSSRSGMAAQQEKLDSISNNIANANTEGYKRTDVKFKDLVYETLNRTGYPVSEANAEKSYNGTGVRTTEWSRDNGQGNLTETGIKTDLALDGQGYFQVELPEQNEDGSFKKAYVRGGSFNIDSNGQLVDKSGNRLSVQWSAGTTLEERQLTAANLGIDEQGNIFRVDGQSNKILGKINVYNVISQDSLRSIGDSLYAINTEEVNGVQVPVEVPYVNEDVSIKQGFLELSNVDLGREMTDMIIAQRAFELSSKAMRTADEMWGMANNLRGR